MLVSRSSAATTAARAQVAPAPRGRSPAAPSSSAPASPRRRARRRRSTPRRRRAQLGQRSSRFVSISDTTGPRRSATVADHHPNDVWLVDLSSAGAVADASSERGQRPELVGEGGEQRGAGRRDELDVQLDSVERRALAAARGSRAGAAASGRGSLGESAATGSGDRRRDRRQLLQRQGDAADVGDRIERARPRGSGLPPARAVNAASASASRRNASWARPPPAPAGPRRRSARGRPPVRRVAGGRASWRAPPIWSAGARDGDLHLEARAGERRQPSVTLFGARARVEQRAEQHVARRARDAVDVEELLTRPRRRARSARRSFRRRARRRC